MDSRRREETKALTGTEMAAGRVKETEVERVGRTNREDSLPLVRGEICGITTHVSEGNMMRDGGEGKETSVKKVDIVGKDFVGKDSVGVGEVTARVGVGGGDEEIVAVEEWPCKICMLNIMHAPVCKHALLLCLKFASSLFLLFPSWLCL